MSEPITLYETWTKTPKNKIVAGTDGGANLSVCKTLYQDNYHPGKVYEPNCNIGYGGKEISQSDFLYFDSNKNFKWSKDAIDKIKGGSEGGRDLYICRAYKGSGFHPGKTWDNYDNCNIGWGGQEYKMSDFEYLTYDCAGDNMYFTQECDSEGNNQGTDVFKKRKAFCNKNSDNANSTKCINWCKSNSTHCSLLNTLNDCKKYNVPNDNCTAQNVNNIVAECKLHGMLSEQGLPIGSYPCTADGIDSFKTACKFYNLVPGTTCNATALDNAKLSAQSKTLADAAQQQSQQQFEQTRKILDQVIQLPNASPSTTPPPSSLSPPASSNDTMYIILLVIAFICLFLSVSSSFGLVASND